MNWVHDLRVRFSRCRLVRVRSRNFTSPRVIPGHITQLSLGCLQTNARKTNPNASQSDSSSSRLSVSILKRSEEHTSELQSHLNLVCRLLLEKKMNATATYT